MVIEILQTQEGMARFEGRLRQPGECTSRNDINERAFPGALFRPEPSGDAESLLLSHRRLRLQDD
jgi:hypothetical protein